MEMISANGIRVAVDEAGSGEPVVLVGGSGMTVGTWDLSIRPDLVAAGYRVIAFDGRGAGASEAPPPPYSVADMAADTIAVIEERAGGRCRLVGLSLGGFVAEEVCRSRPDLVMSVVLIASTGPTTAFIRAKLAAEADLFGDGRPVPASYARMEGLSVTLPPETLQDDDAAVELWGELLSAAAFPTEDGRRGQDAAARDWLLDDDRVRHWPRMRVPALFVAFAHDIQFPPGRARLAAEAWPGAEVVEIAGVAHGNGPFEAARELGAAITGFFARP